MHKHNSIKKWYTIEAIIIDIIVAFIISVAILFITNMLFNKQITSAIEVINTLSVKTASTNNNATSEAKIDLENNKLVQYPEYGTRYGNLKIESIGVNLPLYYGDKLSILNNGIGQSSGAYFPGEGGSVICMGHNYKGFLDKLPETKNGDIIEIDASYGTFKYKIYDSKIVNMYDVDQLPVQKDEEILMLYTCYPINGLGHRTDRYVVYAKLEK